MIASAPSSAGTAWFLDGITNLQQQETQVQRELSSGYQVQDASDAPAQTPELVVLGSSLAETQAYQTTLTLVQSEATTADQALGTAISLLRSAQTLATSGASSTATVAGRQTIAGQIQAIQQQLVSVAGTTVEGRYIFGGDQDQSAPYQYDASSATGVDRLTAQNSTRTIVNTQGLAVYQGLSAAQIFDTEDSSGAPASNNTFAALQSLVNALNANDTTGIANSITAIGNASVWLNQQQGYYGSAEQTITNEQNVTADQVTNLQVQISGIRDTNVTQAATELTQLSTDQSAAYAAQAAIPVKSLFDYLG